MALIQLQQPFLTFRGRNDLSGGQVIYPSSGRNFARTFVQPANPNSTAQAAIRSFLTLASQAYAAVTDAEFEAWETLSANLLRADPNGTLYDTTPKGIYVGVNVNRQINGETITDTAPPAVIQAGITGIISVDPPGSGNPLLIEFSHANSSGFFLFQITQALSGLRRQPREGDFFMPSTDLEENIAAQTASPQTLSIPEANLRYLPQSGDRIGIRVTSLSPGFVSGQVRQFVVTVA